MVDHFDGAIVRDKLLLINASGFSWRFIVHRVVFLFICDTVSRLHIPCPIAIRTGGVVYYIAT
jgi:hypothetical protein